MGIEGEVRTRVGISGSRKLCRARGDEEAFDPPTSRAQKEREKRKPPPFPPALDNSQRSHQQQRTANRCRTTPPSAEALAWPARAQATSAARAATAGRAFRRRLCWKPGRRAISEAERVERGEREGEELGRPVRGWIVKAGKEARRGGRRAEGKEMNLSMARAPWRKQRVNKFARARVPARSQVNL